MTGLVWFHVLILFAAVVVVCALAWIHESCKDRWVRNDRQRIEVERKLAEMRIDQVKQQTINQLFEQASMAQRNRKFNDDLLHRHP